MPLGYLANIGDALKKRTTFGKDLPITPPFNPNAAATMPSAGGLPNIAATGAGAAGIAAPPQAAPKLDLSGEGVPIPQLPGRSGGPRPADPVEKAKYEHVMEGTRDAAGNLGNKVPRRWQDVAMNALIGGVKGASASPQNPLGGLFGGAATAGIGTAIDPTAGREFRFDTTMRPGVEADIERGQRTQDRDYQQQRRRLEIEDALAGIEGRRAQTDATRAGMKDAEMERGYRQSQIDLNRARQEAVLKGKPVVKDVLDEDGVVRTYQIYPDGTRIPVGGSAANAMLGQRMETQKEIAGQNNATRREVAAGANATRVGIETMKEGGRNARMNAKQAPAGGSAPAPAKAKSVSLDQVRRFAAEKGISEAVALQRFKAKGLNVQ